MNSQPPEPKDPKPSDSYVQSFARGLEVIRSFSAATPQQTLSEVAAQTGLTRAGARRILLTLQTLGYVETDGKLFRLSPRILDLGFAYLSSLPIWNLAEPVMEDLVEEVRESSSAAVLDGLDIVYVLRVPTHKIMRTTLGVGSRLPACWTSMGRMLLAGAEEHCLSEIAIIVAALSVPDPRERPADKAAHADQKHARLKDENSDFLSLLKLWQEFEARKQHLSRAKLRQYCRDHFLSYVRMTEWHDIHGQIMEEIGRAHV